MSLQFITGSSGSGKSTWLYEQVISEAGKHPQKRFLFLVPEQFTMQTQKEFVSRHPAHSILNIDVLSFQRLAYRVFDDLGMTDFVVLEETGKNLVLRKAVSAVEDTLSVLRANMRKAGYISEMKSLLSELVQYHVTIEDLEQVREELEEKNALWYKLGDIIALYREYHAFLKGRYITADEIVSLLTKAAPQSGMLKGSVVVLDGYTGFTPVQLEFLETLLPLAESVQVAVTIDNREPVYGRAQMQELFYLSRQSIQVLQETALRQGVAVLAPVVLDNGHTKRYRGAPAIFHLEQNLFRRSPAKYWKPQNEIQICSLFQPKDELRFVAGEIRRLVSQESYRYIDLAVVTGDVPSYANYAEEVFGLFDIPIFIDQKKNILFHPMIELIRAVLQMETADYTYESVMRFFKSGLSGMENFGQAGAADLLENYVLAFGIRGFSRWKKNWVRPAAWLDEEQLAGINTLRAHFAELFTPFHQVFHQKQASVCEMATALYELFTALQMQEQIAKQKEQFEALGMLAQAKENEQIYGIVIRLLEKLVELLGAQTVTVREFTEILEAGFEASNVGIIPPGYDRVLFGDIERTRLEHIKVLFFIGVNDGIIPKNDAKSGILSEFEREKLSDLDLTLAPTAREEAFIQKFYLYLNMTKPSEKLYLTYSQTGQEGATRRKSYLIGAVKKLFPKLNVQSPAEYAPGAAATPKSSMHAFLSGLAQAKEHQETAEWKALYAWYMRHEKWARTAADYVAAAFTVHEDSALSGQLCRQLYGNVLENSVTRLERFAGCAFAHFLQYGLKLAKRQMHEFEPVDFGNILHQALEQFAKRMQAAGDDWFHLTPQHQQQYAAEAVAAAIASCSNTALADGARNQYLVRRMEKVLNRTIEVLGEQIRSGSFIPENYEVSFQYVNRLDAIRFTLGEEEKMRLSGRIDRLDAWEREREVYVRVIDYKSGNTSFQLLSVYHGLQLQLVVYLNAAMELARRKYPGKEIKPAGIFYYHIDDPLLETEEELSEEEIREQIFAKLKLDGYVNSDPQVYHAMDHGMGASSHIIPVTENKDGSLRKNSKAASEEQFGVLSDYVSRKIMELGRRMMQGEIDVNPYELGDRTPCGYCPYRSVCGFDERMEGYAYRKLAKFDQAGEILERMKERED
ncbi:MAG: helicase-exonuclease AddAB subunit AddB [Eubacterium sp.]|nr:helicase-exonuclease AddAB subunit AddB [Eubacterium sp.]